MTLAERYAVGFCILGGLIGLVIALLHTWTLTARFGVAGLVVVGTVVIADTLRKVG